MTETETQPTQPTRTRMPPVADFLPHLTGPRDQLTEAEVARLRASHPDDPVPLPTEHLACADCGVAVAAAVGAPEVVIYEYQSRGPRATLSWSPGPAPREHYRVCERCVAVRRRAEALVPLLPRPLVARIGSPSLVAERVAGALHGLALIGKDSPDDAAVWELQLPRLHPVTHGIRFGSPLSSNEGLCCPYPWAHVSLKRRADIRAAYAAALRDRVLLGEPPVSVPCPSGGCLMCGLAAEPGVPPLHIARGRKVWTPYSRPRRVDGGHLCSRCASAVQAEGAWGHSAIVRAVAEHVRRTHGEQAASRFRALTDDGVLTHLRPHDETGLPPSPVAWAHFAAVLDPMLRVG